MNNRQRDEDNSQPAASSGLLLKICPEMILLALLFILSFLSLVSLIPSFFVKLQWHWCRLHQILMYDVSWIIKSDESKPHKSLLFSVYWCIHWFWIWFCCCFIIPVLSINIVSTKASEAECTKVPVVTIFLSPPVLSLTCTLPSFIMHYYSV